MKYRVLFCLSSPKMWMDQVIGDLYEINEAHRKFASWVDANYISFPLERWALVEETVDPASLPLPNIK